ncbi:MAG: hypothetical protein M1401_17855 [Chloroflexi bacterium]|nr:hypothetical protein [Chloroflexota bacterium]
MTISKDRSLNGLVERLLLDHPSGMQVEEVVEALTEVSPGIQLRGIRNALNELVASGVVVRQRQAAAGRGAPPFRYYHKEHLKHHGGVQLLLPDLVPGLSRLQIETRSDVERTELDEDERERQDRSRSVVDELASRHLDADSVARAVIDVALRIAEEKPIEILLGMAMWMVADINATGEELCNAHQCQNLRSAESLANEIEMRLHIARRILTNFFRLEPGTLHSEAILDLPDRAKDYLHGEHAILHKEAARSRLETRVFGERVIESVTMVCDHKYAAATDASVADVFFEHDRGSFVPPDPVAMMISAAALRRRADTDGDGYDYQDFDIFPDRLRDYTNAQAALKGLVLSPLFRSMLPEDDYKHSRLAAMDLRQYAQDRRVIVNDAEWRPMGTAPVLDIIPRPSLVIRDGRIMPLVHRLKDYESRNLYGHLVRAEIEQFGMSFDGMVRGPSARSVYAATVKSPELSWLAPVVLWYIHTNGGESTRVVSADHVYRPPFADTAVSHLLFLGLAKANRGTQEDRAYRTFRVMRRFSDFALSGEADVPLLENPGRRIDENSEADWGEYLKERLAERKHQRARGRDPGELLDPESGEYDWFVHLCAHAGVVMGYGAPAATYVPLVRDDQGAHFLLPRLEVAVDIQDLKEGLVGLEGPLSWLVSGGAVLDYGHTQSAFQTEPGAQGGGLPVLVPDVVLSAHEAATFARTLMSEEFTDQVRALIAMLRRKSDGRHQL